MSIYCSNQRKTEVWETPRRETPRQGTQLKISLREAQDKEYTEEMSKKDLHDPDDHDGVITHLEPNILECEVK